MDSTLTATGHAGPSAMMKGWHEGHRHFDLKIRKSQALGPMVIQTREDYTYSPDRHANRQNRTVPGNQTASDNWLGNGVPRVRIWPVGLRANTRAIPCQRMMTSRVDQDFSPRSWRGRGWWGQ